MAVGGWGLVVGSRGLVMVAERMVVSQDPSGVGNTFELEVLESMSDADVMCRRMAGRQDLSQVMVPRWFVYRVQPSLSAPHDQGWIQTQPMTQLAHVDLLQVNCWWGITLQYRHADIAQHGPCPSP